MAGVAARAEAPPSGWSRARVLAERPTVGLALRAGALLLVYLVLDRWLVGLTLLPEAAYAGPVIATGLVERLLAEPRLDPGHLLRMGLPLVLAGLVALRPGPVLARWSDLEEGPLLRVLVAVPTLLLAWAFGTYEYNLYFDRSHLPDRLALLALGGLVLWRPVFVLPFVTVAAAIVRQFHHPIGGYSVAEPFLLVRWLLLFLAFFLLRAAGSRHRGSDFVFLALTLLAASYLVAGVGKIRLGWYALGDVALLLPATFANGWLGFLDPGVVGALTERLMAADALLVAGTFVVECGALLCLVRRRVLHFFLVAWPLFHLSVFALSGILFWKWMVLEAVVLALLLRRPGAASFRVFTLRHAILSVPLVLGGTLWFRPVDLSWYNAAVSYAYRFEGVGESGRRFSLPPSFFRPYDYQFTISAFAYLSAHRQLGVAWGATRDRETAAAMLEARGRRDVEALERERGALFHDPVRAARLDAFLQRFIDAWDRRRPGASPLRTIAAPPHLWTFHGPDAFDGSERLVRVDVVQVTSLFDGSEYVEVRRRPVHSVEIPGPPPDHPPAVRRRVGEGRSRRAQPPAGRPSRVTAAT